ncbi:MAG: OmpA family protein [Myxococcota bacterium]
MSTKTIRRDALVAPGPLVTNLVTSSKHRVVIAWHRHATLFEFEDALFRTNSAVMMPASEHPKALHASGKLRTAVGLVASVLRVVEEHPSRSLLVAGHTDTTGGDESNIKLSEWRASCVAAVLTGDADLFVKVCHSWARMRVADYQQILTWLAQTHGWDCDPGGIDDQHGNATQRAVNEFRKAYNERGPGSRDAAKVTPWGAASNEETWRAYFHCYEDALREELGEDAAGVAALRSKLQFVLPRQKVGCGEHHPKEAENHDEFCSQTNRRVEVLLFERSEVPAMTCHPGPGQCQHQTCELYDRERFRRRVLPPLLSAKRWSARWDADLARAEDTRTMTVETPGLPDGVPLTFTVTQQGHGVVLEQAVPSGGQRAELVFDDWDHPASYVDAGDLGRDRPFEEVRFSFVVEGGGRRVEGGSIVYRDRLHLQIELDDGTPLGHQPVRVLSPWGTRRTETDEHGTLDVDGLPPGGASVVLRERTLVHLDELPHDWFGDDEEAATG